MLTATRPQSVYESSSHLECQAVADEVAETVQRLTGHGVIVVREAERFHLRMMMRPAALRVVREMLSEGAHPDEITEREVNDRLEEEDG